MGSSWLLRLAALFGVTTAFTLHTPASTGCFRAQPSTHQRLGAVELAEGGSSDEGREVDELASAFSAEALRRKSASSSAARSSNGQPFAETGIREVVLRDGQPIAIPRRPPPPSVGQQGGALLSTVGLAFGALLTVGSLGLLLAIANADAGA
mmetsp:Transcript_9403/g.30113  ORF Transcript_9403/g.30113 Transcript_9403/m.30113 type:complete len:152 (-) Transcript_9403:633-1088(-)